MRLICFSVKNYRSIQEAYKLPLSNYSVIVGPNNEGKSNILRALALSLQYLTGNKVVMQRRSSVRSYRDYDRFDYDWNRDFPLQLQRTKPNGSSIFTLEFELSEEEFNELNSNISIKLTTNLRIKISIGKSNIDSEVLMPGPTKKALNEELPNILKFIEKKLFFQHIPAIRTSTLVVEIVDNLLSMELSTLESNQDYQDILDSITNLQQPIIKHMTDSLKNSISGFVPEVKDVKIRYQDNYKRRLSSWCEVFIDDGIETSLQAKGDGIISLTAISLLQHISKQGAIDKRLIMLVEEPESHLHPSAIHNLKKVLTDISNVNQVIVTTHSPIMVDRTNVTNNIIVQSGKASKARNIKNIRDSLGISVSDNLSAAELILLVEGNEDKIILKTWLKEKSTLIKRAFDSGKFAIDHMGGSTNLAYKASLYKTLLCNVIVFLDNDNTGRFAKDHALKKGIINETEYLLSNCRGMKNSEIEDLIKCDTYSSMLSDDYSVRIDVSKFKHNKDVWSNRLKDTFHEQGKDWSDQLEMTIKGKIAKEVEKRGLESLDEHKEHTIDKLTELIVKQLEL